MGTVGTKGLVKVYLLIVREGDTLTLGRLRYTTKAAAQKAQREAEKHGFTAELVETYRDR